MTEILCRIRCVSCGQVEGPHKTIRFSREAAHLPVGNAHLRLCEMSHELNALPPLRTAGHAPYNNNDFIFPDVKIVSIDAGGSRSLQSRPRPWTETVPGESMTEAP